MELGISLIPLALTIETAKVDGRYLVKRKGKNMESPEESRTQMSQLPAERRGRVRERVERASGIVLGVH